MRQTSCLSHDRNENGSLGIFFLSGSELSFINKNNRVRSFWNLHHRRVYVVHTRCLIKRLSQSSIGLFWYQQFQKSRYQKTKCKLPIFVKFPHKDANVAKRKKKSKRKRHLNWERWWNCKCSLWLEAFISKLRWHYKNTNCIISMQIQAFITLIVPKIPLNAYRTHIQYGYVYCSWCISDTLAGLSN